MKKYFKRKSPMEVSPNVKGSNSSQPSKQSRMGINETDLPANSSCVEINVTCLPSNPSRVEINLADLPSDPGLRPGIMDYNPNDRDQIRRAYLQKGPCQPRDHNFRQTQFGKKRRKFVGTWFTKFPTWLEYSIAKEAAYCLCCYLFKPDIGHQSGGESFVGEGFSNWKKCDRIQTHVGGPNSAHNQAE